MLSGKSALHVNQSIGQHFEVDEIKGYYNDMREKVSFAPEHIDNASIPFVITEKGNKFYFPVAIFQYAFGLLDFYYETKETKYIEHFKRCVEWTIQNQLDTGAWDNFSYYYPTHPYGAMAQGEGASLLIRAYTIYGDEKYLIAAKKAIDFMLIDANVGGCTEYKDDNVILLEYPHRKAVLNGWIFAWWGLYDYVLVTNDKSEYRTVLEKSLASMIALLPAFKNANWSIYDLEKRIASPFYHNLHIAQMQAMYQLTGEQIFNEYAKCWSQQQKNPFCKGIAFVMKSIQKILEHE